VWEGSDQVIVESAVKGKAGLVEPAESLGHWAWASMIGGTQPGWPSHALNRALLTPLD
jgi:hypothetical protein